mmetsp:Transcript_33771/g.77964  ORF Transcript_33771/g.77964 Transcript_33771/m.77964 type:complete len:289 (-) Transcript_33771:17-883(-)
MGRAHPPRRQKIRLPRHWHHPLRGTESPGRRTRRRRRTRTSHRLRGGGLPHLRPPPRKPRTLRPGPQLRNDRGGGTRTSRRVLLGGRTGPRSRRNPGHGGHHHPRGPVRNLPKVHRPHQHHHLPGILLSLPPRPRRRLLPTLLAHPRARRQHRAALRPHPGGMATKVQPRRPRREGARLRRRLPTGLELLSHLLRGGLSFADGKLSHSRLRQARMSRDRAPERNAVRHAGQRDGGGGGRAVGRRNVRERCLFCVCVVPAYLILEGFMKYGEVCRTASISNPGGFHEVR